MANPSAEIQVGSSQRVQTRSAVGAMGRFLLRFLEFQIPMVFGALVCYLLGLLIASSSGLATVYHPGTYLYATMDVLFLTVPTVAWMIFRHHGWRYSLETMVAMIAPVAAIMVLGQLAGLAAYDYLRWLLLAGYPAMCLGMLVYMLYRREHFMGRVGQATHPVDPKVV
jgi:hypothetical protein